MDSSIHNIIESNCQKGTSIHKIMESNCQKGSSIHKIIEQTLKAKQCHIFAVFLKWKFLKQPIPSPPSAPAPSPTPPPHPPPQKKKKNLQLLPQLYPSLHLKNVKHREVKGLLVFYLSCLKYLNVAFMIEFIKTLANIMKTSGGKNKN